MIVKSSPLHPSPLWIIFLHRPFCRTPDDSKKDEPRVHRFVDRPHRDNVLGGLHTGWYKLMLLK